MEWMTVVAVLLYGSIAEEQLNIKSVVSSLSGNRVCRYNESRSLGKGKVLDYTCVSKKPLQPQQQGPVRTLTPRHAEAALLL